MSVIQHHNMLPGLSPVTTYVRFFIFSIQIARLVFQSFNCTLNVSWIFVLSRTEYAGRLAGVGYSAVEIGLTPQGLLIISFIANAKSNHEIIPSLL